MVTAKQAKVVRAGSGKRFSFPMGNQAEVKAARADGLAFGLMTSALPPGAGMPLLHLHRDMDEAFAIVAGAIQYRLGESYLTAVAGDTVLIPAGVPHCFRSTGPDDAAVLIVFSTHDGVEMIDELAAGNLMDPAFTSAVLARYHSELLEPHPHRWPDGEAG